MVSLNQPHAEQELAQARAQVESLTIALITERRQRLDLENEASKLRDYVVSLGGDFDQ